MGMHSRSNYLPGNGFLIKFEEVARLISSKIANIVIIRKDYLNRQNVSPFAIFKKFMGKMHSIEGYFCWPTKICHPKNF